MTAHLKIHNNNNTFKKLAKKKSQFLHDLKRQRKNDLTQLRSPLLKVSFLDLYNSFITFFLKSGKKLLVKSLIDEAFFKLSKKHNCTQHYLLLKFFSRIKTFVEVKKVKIRRKVHFVPFALSNQRRIHTSLKWLALAIRTNKSPTSFVEKLVQELSKIVSGQTCITVSLLNKNNKLAVSNRSNIHYRW